MAADPGPVRGAAGGSVASGLGLCAQLDGRAGAPDVPSRSPCPRPCASGRTARWLGRTSRPGGSKSRTGCPSPCPSPRAPAACAAPPRCRCSRSACAVEGRAALSGRQPIQRSRRQTSLPTCGPCWPAREASGHAVCSQWAAAAAAARTRSAVREHGCFRPDRGTATQRAACLRGVGSAIAVASSHGSPLRSSSGLAGAGWPDELSNELFGFSAHSRYFLAAFGRLRRWALSVSKYQTA